MNLRRFRAVARKEFIHVIRDPRALGIAIVLPLVLLTLFGYALTLDVDKVPIVIWDQSQTPQSRDLASRFTASRYFSLVRSVDSYGEIVDALDHGRALMGLVLPVEFGRMVSAGRPVEVQLIADGSDSNTATIAMGYADAVVQKYSLEAGVSAARRLLGGTLKAPLELRSRAWFNMDMESKDNIVPGLIAVIMMLIAALLTSLTVAKEWETGTMEQLISTPVRPVELVLGKLAPYFTIGMLDMFLSVAAGRWLFGVPLRGSLLALVAMSAIYLAGSLSMGMLISATAKNQLLASQMAFMTTFLPAFLLSGFMFDIENMPRALRWVTYVVPARYFVTMLRGLYLKGVGPSVLYPEGLLLLLFGTVMMVLAVRVFRKKLE
ncbi:MAG: ABC transporter permease [Acidobacteria bacterium]|jgi:ABC-2 type transport system permease protein|nr:ABC transporter permease [Acidobacteriota bacterium]